MQAATDDPLRHLRTRRLMALVLLGAPAFAAGGGDDDFHLVECAHGFGQLLPHRVHELDGDGNPTPQVLDVRSFDDLLHNVRPDNPLLPSPSWPGNAELPGGAPGNHFLRVRFDRVLDTDSVLSNDPGSPSGLVGTIAVTGFDPTTGDELPLAGRGFVGGRTYAGPLRFGRPGAAGLLALQTWVEREGGGTRALPGVDADGDGVPDGLGFPGTESAFPGDELLVRKDTFVFVADTDGDLATHETFPAGLQLRVRVTDVRAADGTPLGEQALASGTVGSDHLPPEVLFTPAPNAAPMTTPGNGELDVDPLTAITVEFSEPLQPFSVGDLPDGSYPTPSDSITIAFGPPTLRTSVPFTALPHSPFDLSRWTLQPVFAFPGQPALPAACGSFHRVDGELHPQRLMDLAANANQLAAAWFFDTGEGPGLVNAPVAPDAIYAVSAGGSGLGLSVIDLNGFGASTGDPTFDPANPAVEGNSNFPNNPNVFLQGALLRPPLAPGNCTVDGGAAGVFRRTLDANLDPRLVRAPIVLELSDLALGHALDAVFHDGPPPMGCQSGGGNLCALSALKVIEMMQLGPNTIGPPITNNPILNTTVGGENVISWAPHPNPPPLVFPPLCVAPHVGGLEPTSVETVLPPPQGPGLQNLLVPGDPFGDPAAGIPPSGLLSPEQNAWFRGPSPPATHIGQCQEFMIRQKVGQFLYAVDRDRREVVVLDSNRMHVLDRVPLPDPTELALSTDLELLAVTNQAADSVAFIDIDPASSTFHEVVATATVGAGPRGVAWEPGNEDVLVCNEDDGTLSIVSVSSLTVRKTVSGHLTAPFAVAITPRQDDFGYQRNVYFAYVVNRDGTVAIFESGPDGVNGWGYDDVIGRAPFLFRAPKAIQPDLLDLGSGAWLAHEGAIDLATGVPGPLGTPALSLLQVDSTVFFQLPLNLTPGPPQFRDMEIDLLASLDDTVLSGIPVDLCFDDLRNFGGLENYHTAFSAGAPARVNGKNLVRRLSPSVVVNASESRYLFVAAPQPGVVDVIDLNSGLLRIDTNAFQPGVQSIPVPGVRLLMDYFRQ